VQLMEEFGADGAMIATEAEKNPSCFRPDSQGGPHEWRSQWKVVVTEYMRFALQVENRWGNTKYLLGQMIPGKEKMYQAMNKSRCYADVIAALGLEDVEGMLEKANIVDQHLGIPPQESKQSKKARMREANKQVAPVKEKKEKRKEMADEQPEAKRVKMPEPESEPQVEVAMLQQSEASAPATLSV
jgi:tRNA-dihydrouridine synthase 2